MTASDSIALAALLVSCVGLLVAGLSLGWQILSWLFDGRRVRLALVFGVYSPGQSFTARVRARGRLPSMRSIREQGIEGPEVFGIVVTNVGRATVTIERYSLRARPGKFSVIPHGERTGPQLPYRLPAGESATWFIEAVNATALIAATGREGKANRVSMSVTLGTGDERWTRNSAVI